MMSISYSIGNDGVYRSGELVVTSAVAERVLAHLYYSFEAQGLLEIIFHEGAKPSLRWFLDTYLNPETSTLICFRESTAGDFHLADGLWATPLGMAWFNRAWKIGENFCKAETGMAFLRKIPLDDTLTAAKLFLAWAFNTRPLDSIIGMTPSPNRAAVLFGQKVGFTQAGPVYGYTAWHGRLCSAVVSSMTRAQWKEIHDKEMRLS